MIDALAEKPQAVGSNRPLTFFNSFFLFYGSELTAHVGFTAHMSHFEF